ncbi:MAG: hypothetical protein ACRD22_03450 [Terriglobia bacterium]
MNKFETLTMAECESVSGGQTQAPPPANGGSPAPTSGGGGSGGGGYGDPPWIDSPYPVETA